MRSNLVVGLVGMALVLPLRVAPAAEYRIAQVGGRAVVHDTLNNAIEAYRQTDFDRAAVLLQQVQARLDDLTPTERNDYARVAQDNTQALRARLEGAEMLRLAEKALAEGRAGEAIDLEKKLTANGQFLSPPDRQRLTQLEQQLRARSAQPAAPSAVNPVAAARSKVSQARAAMAQSNFEAAEALARDAERLNVTFGPAEDTPARILADLGKTRTDPKALLRAARAALQRQELDRAERYAHLAEKNSSLLSFPVWGDTPAKVLQAIQAERKRIAAAPPPGVTTTTTVYPPTTDPKAPPAGPAAGKNTQARELLRQGRQALEAGDLARARKLNEEARALAADFTWVEDNPKKLGEDIARAEARPAKPTDKPAAASAAPSNRKQDAASLLEQGRAELRDNKLEEAFKTAQRAKAATPSAGASLWGLFEDTPDKLMRDVQAARMKRDQDESYRILAEGRRLLEQHDYPKARLAAYRALKLHGTYSMWDLGDRPNKLLADVEAAEADARRKKSAETAVADSKPARPDKPADKPPEKGRPEAHPPQDPVAAAGKGQQTLQARQLLAQARLALQDGNTARARQLAEQARAMPVAFNPAEGDTPEAVLRDLEARAGSKPPAPSATAAAPDGKRARAMELVAQARQLQKQGQFVAARQKALEAQGLGVPFGPEDDCPDLALQQIGFAARQRIDALMNRAQEKAAYGNGDPLPRYESAERDLLEARQLVAGFALDPLPVERKIEWIHNLRARAGAPTGTDTQARRAGDGAPQARSAGDRTSPGRTLLESARQELFKGETASARRMAEEACQEHFGVRREAMMLLRSIDQEEFNQKQLAARRTFKAAVSAFNRREYDQAGALLSAINPRFLAPEQQAKLKEMGNTPEMQPSAVGRLARARPDGRGPIPGASEEEGPGNRAPSSASPGASADPTAGRARATDAPELSLVQRTQALRSVAFQKERSDSLKTMTEAAEKFRAGETEEALNLLQDHLAHLDTLQLDAGQVTLLKRPVESRLYNFRLRKAQRDMQRETASAHQFHHDENENIRKREELKQKTISNLMKEFNSLYSQGKYLEAENLAMKGKELDPDNGVVTAAVYMARMQRHRTTFQKGKEGREEAVLQALNTAEDEGPPDVITKNIHFDPETSERTSKRAALSTQVIGRKNAREMDIERRLLAPVNINFRDMPLRQVIDELRAVYALNIYVDTPALDEESINPEHRLSIKLEGVSLKSALNMLLHEVHLTYVIKDEALQITTEAHARGKLVPVTYQVADLVIPVENYGDVGNPSFPMQLGGADLDAAPQMPTPTPTMSPMSLTSGTSVGSPTGSNFASAGGGGTGGVNVTKKGSSKTMEETLIKLVTSTVQPRSWSDMGGPGTIDYFPMTMSLVVNQTPDIQDQIADLLAALRRLQDQEVAVEVRFITINENFFERIGVNFQMNIVNNSGKRYQPQITTGNFAPPFYINKFDPTNFIAGLTPAGTFTSSLDIPITTNTFQQALPPFGGYPGIPGFGGLTFGLGFLSDIQVFLFMEAVQGDTRTNVMQAPKLTLFNGQTATLSVFDQQFFVLGVSIQGPQGTGGQFLYRPIIRPFPIGVNLTIQAVISADRRFVRMSLTPTLTNLATPIVELFPVVTPIFPQFDGGAFGQPVVFTQFIQQPIITTVTVNTTVAVPDGGTVLMGGLKRLSEGRNEFGPPILSKLPYLNRLFKNVGYGRETDSLLLMVTPRIIIQEEEELRQTGVERAPAVFQP